MIFFTGDIHGAVDGIAEFITKVHPTMEDIIVLLGDVGANYYNGRKDYLMKQWLNDSGTRFLCIHGNHEMRPVHVSGYIETEWCGGKGWLQPEYPNLIFARDGEIYTMNGLQYLVIGGAYSVDKYYRLSRGWSWWPDEQPSPEIKAYVEQQIREKHFDIVLSHTCPFKYYEPTEMFLDCIDQCTVDEVPRDGLIQSRNPFNTKHGSADTGIRTNESIKCIFCSVASSQTNSSKDNGGS